MDYEILPFSVRGCLALCAPLLSFFSSARKETFSIKKVLSVQVRTYGREKEDTVKKSFFSCRTIQIFLLDFVGKE